MSEARRLLQVTDKIIAGHPEVAYVLGKVGRADSATDPAPVEMIETIILLKPQAEWRPGITRADIIGELDSMLQVPGLSNGWTQPIINRINMLSTGIRTDLGIKVFGPELGKIGELSRQIEEQTKEAIDDRQREIVLREQLREGRFDGGLPGELALMAQFGVARVTVRRALSQLAEEGLIQREPGRGTRPVSSRAQEVQMQASTMAMASSITLSPVARARSLCLVRM